MSKGRRGRPPIKFDFSEYWAGRIYRERREQVKAIQRTAGTLRAGHPKGLQADCKSGLKVIQIPRLSLEVSALMGTAQKKGRPLSIAAATLAALKKLLRRLDCENMAEFLLEPALHRVRTAKRRGGN